MTKLIILVCANPLAGGGQDAKELPAADVALWFTRVLSGLGAAEEGLKSIRARAVDEVFQHPSGTLGIRIGPRFITDHGTLAATATEVFEAGDNLSKMHQILLIELKRGGFPIWCHHLRRELSEYRPGMVVG